MDHPLFKPRNFIEGREAAVGSCNGLTVEERWQHETPAFAKAIAALLEPRDRLVLDYGCGVGRVAKRLLALRPHLTVIGVDASEQQRKNALAFVNETNFIVYAPEELHQTVDLAFSVYVFQHIPAIEIREALHRIHHFLRPDGYFVHCSAKARMAIRFDQPTFLNDGCLGVDLDLEVERFFEPVRDLFDESQLAGNPVLDRMINAAGRTEENKYIAHPAKVYRRKAISGPLFNIPYPKKPK